MKVTFTCEKCGAELLQPVINPPKNQYGFMTWAAPVDGDVPCPNCSQPSYGPFTEKMVADALHWCGESGSPLSPLAYYDAAHPDQSIIHRQARFVLRLLEEWCSLERAQTYILSKREFGTRSFIYGKNPRDWLLDLAKKSRNQKGEKG